MNDKQTVTFSASQEGAHVGRSTTPEERHQVLSGMFPILKRGGPENRGIVEAIALKPGIFRSTGSNFALCTFEQTDLTR